MNRAPNKQVKSDDMRRVVQRISEVLNQEDINDENGFRQIQDKFLAYLTLSNGRRGGEAGRMTLSQAEEGISGMWIGDRVV